MTRRSRALCALLLLLIGPALRAQTWRQSASSLGTTARVLIIGTHPEDEDNALIAWLSLGHNIETAYLSLTRGENRPNVAGNERQAFLGVVRTAELLAERQRDGAHQYFTRAYDFGFARSDSVVDAGWPHDSLLKDVVSVVRAFRPHVMISLFSEDSTVRDATHRAAARLAREAFLVSGDTTHLPRMAASLLPGWTVSRLFTRVDSAAVATTSIDVGAFDRTSGRSYAELGAEIRRLQRTQPAPPAPPIGHVWRYLRLDNPSAEGGTGLFSGVDTAWRFRAQGNAQPLLDSLRVALTAAGTLARAAPADSLAVALARVAKRATDVRAELSCTDVAGVPACPGELGDLAASLTAIRERATRAFMSAAGIVIDGTVDRELVATRDSVPVTVTVFNGGATPIALRRLAAAGRTGLTMLVRDTVIVILPDSLVRRTGYLRVQLPTFNWWQVNGLQPGTWLHILFSTPRRPVVDQLIGGEDRVSTSAVEATIGIGDIDIPVIERPLAYRSPVAIRGDARHTLAGVPPLSVLLERKAEYERANLRIDRLFRVYLSSARTTQDTVTVTLQLPAGLKADSASRVVVLPPLGHRNEFFRLRGLMKPGADSIMAAAQLGDRVYRAGTISFDYPHIPSQQFMRSSNLRLEAVDLRVPPRLRVAYIKGTDDVQTWLGQLQVNVQALEPSLLPVVDLSVFSTVLIGADAFANDALMGAVPALRGFMRNGGTVVVLPGGEEIARSGLLPFTIAYDSVPQYVRDPEAEIRVTDAKSPLVTWPNAITAADFQDWSEERARNVPAAFDARYRTVLLMGDAGQPATAGTILMAPVGKGTIVYTSLSLDKQLAAVHAGAARLFVNLLAAGMSSAPRARF